MNVARSNSRGQQLRAGLGFVALLALAGALGTPARAEKAKISSAPAKAQDNSAKNPDAGGNAQNPSPNLDNSLAGDEDQPAAPLPANATPAQRIDRAWSLLTEAAGDAKHPQTRIEAVAALGLLRTERSEKMIVAAMADPDVDVRTAAALAAGETEDRNLTTPLRNMLDDKEPQVAFAAALTLWKMNDRSGEDILMAVVDGDRSANPTLMHGTEHKIDKDLHDPAKLARLGAMQGAAMLLGPFGVGIAALEFIHQSDGDVARASAIEDIAQERTEPIHKELIAALGDKDPIVRAAAAKGLADYRDNATSAAIYPLFVDSHHAVRLIAAAAYLRTTGVPGPPVITIGRGAAGSRSAASKH